MIYHLSARKERIWNKLLLLAGGDVEILYCVLKDEGKCLSMTSVIERIRALRSQKKDINHA